VNCVGVMGRGIALQFKKQFPDNFKAYEAACKRGEVVPGNMFVFAMNCFVNSKYIINFPTKRRWRGASRIEDIESGLADLVDAIRKNNITSIAVPPLGAGLGGLDWRAVKKRINETLGELSGVEITVYEPGNAPAAEQRVKNKTVPIYDTGESCINQFNKAILRWVA